MQKINILIKKLFSYVGKPDLTGQLHGGVLRLMMASVLNNVVGMLSNMVITRILTKPEYGYWSYTLNIYSYLNLISGLGLLSGSLQFASENMGTAKEFEYYKYCLRIGLLVNSIITAAFLGLTFFVPFAFPEAVPFIRSIAPIILLEYSFQLLLIIFRCQSRIKEYVIVLNINTVLLAVGHCAGALFGVKGVLIGRYGAMICSLVVLCIIAQKEILKIHRTRFFKFKEVGDLWYYSLFMAAVSALNCVLYLLDVSMIGMLMQDSESVAIYKVATLIPTALTFIPNSVTVCIMPVVIRNNKNRAWQRKNIPKAYISLGGLNAVLCSLLVIFAPLIITILSGIQYLPAVPAFRVLVCGYFISGTFRMLSINILAGFRYVKYNLFISIVSGVCDIVFNYFFIQKFGIIGAAYATFGVDLVTAILSFGYVVKKLFYGGKHV